MNNAGLYTLWNNKTPKQKRQKLKTKAPLWLYPKGAEVYYTRLLYAYLAKMEEQLKEYLATSSFRQLAESFRTDADPTDELQKVLNKMEGVANPADVEKELLKVYGKINDTNKEEWAKFQRWAVGVPFFGSEDWIVPTSKLWIRQNMRLIKSLTADVVKKVEVEFNKGFFAGERAETLAKRLSGEGGVIEGMKHRARLIARDQTSKANANLTQRRQEDAGLRLYIWRTSKDENVRPTHQAHEGRVYEYGKSPANTGAPAEDVNCRCHAEGIMAWDLPEDYTDSINGELYSENAKEIQLQSQKVFSDAYGVPSYPTAPFTPVAPRKKRVKRVKKAPEPKVAPKTKAPTAKPKSAKPSGKYAKYNGAIPEGFELATASETDVKKVVDAINATSDKATKIQLKNDFILDFIATPSDDAFKTKDLFNKFDDLAFENAVKGVATQYRFFPELRQNIHYFGEANTKYDFLRKNVANNIKNMASFKENIVLRMSFGYTRAQAEKQALRNFKKVYKHNKITLGSRVFAMSSGRGTLSGIDYKNPVFGYDLEGVALNAKMMKSGKKTQEAFIRNQKSGHFPPNIPEELAYENIISHEFGHEVDRFFSISNDLEFRKSVYKKISEEGLTVSSAVSGYSNEDFKELFAEAYSEFTNAKRPRVIAKMIGEKVEEHIAHYRKTGGFIMDYHEGA